jgi:hypothetical protein
VQPISDELRRILADRLKLGDLAQPVCRVEVDRFIFIPGRTEDIQFKVDAGADTLTLDNNYIADEANGKTSTSPQPIAFPLRGYDLTCKSSNYGMRWGKMHQGVDLAAPIGTDVLAAWSGKVKNVNMKDANNGYGYYVEIQHDNGVWTRYAHLSKPHVSIGDAINQGQMIAESGDTGHVTGPHLHFEIWLGTKPTDPLPYLKGQKQIFNSAYNTGTGVVSEGQMTGQVGEMLFSENFTSMDWFKNPKYKSVDPLLQTQSVIDYRNSNSFSRIDFSGATTSSVSFTLSLYSDQPGVISLKFSSDLKNLGDLRIYVDDKLKTKYVDFRGLDSIDEIRNLAFDAGDREIKVEVRYTGVPTGGSVGGAMMFEKLEIRKLDTRPGLSGNLQFIDPTITDTTQVEQNLSDALFGGDGTSHTSLQVGQFTYMDTLTLDSVGQIELDDQFEMDSRTARITISNPEGYYSPDYNPFYFPEMYQATPWSYSLNGFHYGVLSENAPVRIFLGYGNNMMRVFTGLIDKLDIDNETPQITITCRDMYKKILNKVISEDKEYPKTVGHNSFNASAFSGSNPDMSRKQEIIAKSKYYTSKLSASMDFKFLCAIAMHETEYGTTGAGRPESGSYVLGYGVYSESNRDSTFAGIDRQLYYGGKRYLEAMASKSWQINSLADVTYFWQGGDKGAYQWAADTNWPNAVWGIYSGYLSSPPSDLTDTPAWVGSGIPTVVSSIPAPSDAERPWVKSAIVTDLIDHAGMMGWRSAPNDIYYPDYVIEETYLIELNQRTGKAVMAVPDKEGEFIETDIESILTPQGWMNPYIDQSRSWPAYTAKVSDCLNEVIKDTNYRVYCDRYGTFRLEQIDLKKPVAGTITEYDSIVTLNKTIDYSNARSHVVIGDGKGNYEHFVDTEMLMELKSELRTTLLIVPYATTYEAKRDIAQRFFWDVKRISRTLQISIPGNPALEVLDRVFVSDKRTTTRSTYTIKGIRSTFTVDGGFTQVLDLMWGGEGVVL